jgi:hypothetical protein
VEIGLTSSQRVRVRLYILKKSLKVISDPFALFKGPFFNSLTLIDTLFPSFKSQSQVNVLKLGNSLIEHTVQSLVVHHEFIELRIQQANVHLYVAGEGGVSRCIEVFFLTMSV